MLYRSLHALPWSEQANIEPSELPELWQKDSLMATLIDPYLIYAAWHISYNTQNRLMDLLGEDVFSFCRLILRFQSMDTYADGEGLYLEEDVSGPALSKYVTLGQRHTKPSRELLVFGKIGYQDPEGNFYAITSSSIIQVPHNRLDPGETGEWAPQEEIYNRLYRRTSLNSDTELKRYTVLELAERLDDALGRNYVPARMRAKQ